MNDTPEQDDTTPAEPSSSSRHRDENGKFVSKSEIEKLKAQLAESKKEAQQYLEDQNKVLLRGTGLSEDHFKGMNARQVNQFLRNWHDKKPSEPESEPSDPNFPIVGTPTGSGKQKSNIDDYLKFTLKDGKPDLDFNAPASIVFGKSKNKNEALNKWLEAR